MQKHGACRCKSTALANDTCHPLHTKFIISTNPNHHHLHRLLRLHYLLLPLSLLGRPSKPSSSSPHHRTSCPSHHVSSFIVSPATRRHDVPLPIPANGHRRQQYNQPATALHRLPRLPKPCPSTSRCIATRCVAYGTSFVAYQPTSLRLHRLPIHIVAALPTIHRVASPTDTSCY